MLAIFLLAEIQNLFAVHQSCMCKKNPAIAHPTIMLLET